jgi:hypothetical protein
MGANVSCIGEGGTFSTYFANSTKPAAFAYAVLYAAFYFV